MARSYDKDFNDASVNNFTTASEQILNNARKYLVTNKRGLMARVTSTGYRGQPLPGGGVGGRWPVRRQKDAGPGFAVYKSFGAGRIVSGPPIRKYNACQIAKRLIIRPAVLLSAPCSVGAFFHDFAGAPNRPPSGNRARVI